MGRMSGRFPWPTTLMVVVVLLATTAGGWVLTRPGEGAGLGSPAQAAAGPATLPQPAAPANRPARWTGTAATVPTAPLPAVRPFAVPAPGPELLGQGDRGPEVRDLQARLRQIAWVFGDVDDAYDAELTEAVRGFQEKRRIAITGDVDRRTLDRLLEMTVEPTADELANRFPGDVDTDAPLDPRCLTGRAMCVDKSSSTLRWMVDGAVLRTVAVRFGSEYTPTREGQFSVSWKSRDHVSSLYDTPMPFAMFFSGGQAVHYSADFAATGYDGASHGCVNVRDLPAITALFDEVSVGDKVVVYRS
jgi:peptidoglycan hydrolase-like protein with peptidoglycan-binding domain